METQSVSLDGSGRRNVATRSWERRCLPAYRNTERLIYLGTRCYCFRSFQPVRGLFPGPNNVSVSVESSTWCGRAKFTELTMLPRILFTKKLMEISVNSRLHA